MGDITEMMLDGTLCYNCGAYNTIDPKKVPDWDSPLYCSHSCKKEHGSEVNEGIPFITKKGDICFDN